MTDIRIDMSELKTFAGRLRKADKQLEKDFLKAESAAGELVANSARRKAASFPRKSGSSRISDSVKVKRRGTRVRVEAGGDGAPEAAPIENHGLAGTFRHPVYGNYDNWVAQDAHPFLTPAGEENFDAFESAVLVEVALFEARL